MVIPLHLGRKSDARFYTTCGMIRRFGALHLCAICVMTGDLSSDDALAAHHLAAGRIPSLMSTHLRLDLALQRLTRFWERWQVELHGRYSLERMENLEAYCQRTSQTRVICVLLLAPLPCLALIVLIDLIPIEDPALGLAHSHIFWIRAVLTGVLLSAVCLLELQDCIDGFRLTTKQLAVLSVLGGLTSSAGGLLLSFTIGYPVPFGAQASAPFLQLVLGIGIVVCKGKFFKETPTARPQLRAALRLFGALSILTLVYTACHTAFSKLSGFAQSVSVLSFPLMKILWKNLMARHCRDLEDEKPKLVVMNIEIFHALFSTYCMQGASSFATTASIIAADLLHSWLSLRDVNVRVNRILRLETRENQRKGPQSAHVAPPTGPVFDVSQLSKLPVGARVWRWILQMDARVQGDSIQIQRPPRRPEATASILPSPPYPSKTHDSPPIEAVQETHPVHGSATKARLSPEERGARLQTKKQELLHLTECVLLVEYVEIIIPFIYGVYAYICFHLPTHHFYVHLRSLDEAGLRHAISNVLVYASMEFLTFVMLNCALGQKLPVKPMYQLAFVLETQWLRVQQKLQFWTLFTILQTLQHFGVDFTLKFKWLHTK